MQQNVKEEIRTKIRRKAILSHLMDIVCILVDLIMYYAAGLTLNVLFAGIGNGFVSLIAFLAAAGAAAGRFLFPLIRRSIDRDIAEICMNTLDEKVPDEEDEEVQESLYSLFQDAVHFEMKGRLKAERLLIKDILYVIAVSLLDLRCGLLLGAAVLVNDLLLNIFAKRNVVSASKFRLMSALVPSLPAVLIISALLITALSRLQNGPLGLYGIIMILFILMDLLRSHAEQSSSILKLRKDLRSAEKIEEYVNGVRKPEVTGNAPQEKKEGTGPYLVLAAAFFSAVCLFLFAADGILNILSYRTVYSLKAIRLCIPLFAAAAALCHALFLYVHPETEYSKKLRKAVSAVSGLAALVYAFTVNPLLAGILASALAALTAAVPLFLSMRLEEDPEETIDEHENLYGMIHFLFLILIIAAGIMMYWNSMATFAEVLKITVLYMGVYMCIDQTPFERHSETDPEDEYEQ